MYFTKYSETSPNPFGLQNKDDDESKEAILVCYLMLTLLIVKYDQNNVYATKKNIWPHEVYKLLVTKVHLVKAMVFPVVMYGCESWTIKKAEHRRIDVFELWC